MRHSPKALRRALAAAIASAACLSAATLVHADPIGDVFVIAMENHNWTQPNPASSPQQILNNVAAPYINSLVTPGNANAAQTSFATTYYNAGTGVHPSEPNYVWAEAGTDFGIHTDGDPTVANNNIFTAPHLTGMMNSAGVTWNNYQEDVGRNGLDATHSASGTTGAANPYYGTSQYNYAVKHNPMAFFSDTQTQNVKTFDQLRTDITTDTAQSSNFGRYNWITPNQFNDMHSSLSTDFAYNGTTFTHNTDQEAIAIGDHFLSVIIPQIMATNAYKNNGAIVIWFDETEGSDSTPDTLGEIVISPLAKGNAYGSTVTMNHSSDIKTMQEIFGLGPAFLNNAIPAGEVAATGGLYSVGGTNDLSDLFKAGTIPAAIPEPASLGVLTLGVFGLVARRRRA